MVLVILTRLGEDKVPDWEIQDQDMLTKFKLLASPDTGVKVVLYLCSFLNIIFFNCAIYCT